MTEAIQNSRNSLWEPPTLLPSFPTNLLTLKRGKLMLFLMKRVKFSASRRRAGLEETALTHCPLPGDWHWEVRAYGILLGFWIRVCVGGEGQVL